MLSWFGVDKSRRMGTLDKVFRWVLHLVTLPFYSITKDSNSPLMKDLLIWGVVVMQWAVVSEGTLETKASAAVVAVVFDGEEASSTIAAASGPVDASLLVPAMAASRVALWLRNIQWLASYWT